MKTMTCRQLAGACDMEFHTETFEEMAKLSQEHGTEMFKQNDPGHMKAMQEMGEMMKDPKAMQDSMDKKRDEFNQFPEDK